MFYIQRRYLKKPPKSFFANAGQWLRSQNLVDSEHQYAHNHIVQIGDPVLRKPAQDVHPDAINSPYVKATIDHMKSLIDQYDAVGLAANQIGVPLRIVCVQCTAKQLKYQDPEDVKYRQVETFPKTILINPVLKRTIGDAKVIHREGCCSVTGFSAKVPRYKEILVDYLNEDGKKVTWQAKNWTARILQHELDHLNGILYTDHMIADTFIFNYWKTVNNRKGDFKMNYGKMSALGKFNLFFFPKFKDPNRD